MNAPRDKNRIPALLCASSSDGTTIVPIYADATTHAVVANIANTGSDHGIPNAKRDQNSVTVLMGVSKTDGVTPVEIYGDPTTHAIYMTTS